MRHRIWLAVLLFCCPAAAQESLPAALEKAASEVLAAPLAAGQFSGVVLVEQEGRPLLRKAYGLADREHNVPNTPETPFMIMSVSKQLTAALVLRLVAQGKLGLRDKVGDHLENWPAEWQAVTVHHLLSHSSGLDGDTTFFWLVRHHPEYWPEPGQAPPPYEPRPLLVGPGTTFAYSNVGYTLLTRIAAKAGRKSFDQLMREEVLGPLGMDHTRPERGERVEVRARGYERKGEGFELSEQGTVDIVGAGDLVSTADDLAKWDRALDDDHFLPAKLREAMLTPHVTDPKRGGVGYGWFLREEKGKPAMRFHTGSGAGFRAFNYRLPEQRVTLVVLSNVYVQEAPWVRELLERVAALTAKP